VGVGVEGERESVGIERRGRPLADRRRAAPAALAGAGCRVGCGVDGLQLGE
jgi:hypothetical protein